MRVGWLVLLFVLGSVTTRCALSVAHAQAGPDGALVDQAVADLDPLSVSLRRVEPGLGAPGERRGLYDLVGGALPGGPMGPGEPAEPGAWDVSPGGDGLSQRYLRTGPGFVAHVDRIDYLVRVGRRRYATNIQPARDGEYLELIPANTVFDLRPRYDLFAPPTPAESTGPVGLPDHRIDARIDARIDGRLDLRVRGQAVAPTRIDAPAPMSGATPLGTPPSGRGAD